MSVTCEILFKSVTHYWLILSLSPERRSKTIQLNTRLSLKDDGSYTVIQKLVKLAPLNWYIYYYPHQKTFLLPPAVFQTLVTAIQIFIMQTESLQPNHGMMFFTNKINS